MKSILAGLISLMILSTCAVAPVAAVDSKPSPHVKLITTTGYGSATHIGNGYFLTAEHVMMGKTTATVKLDDGTTVDVILVTKNKLFDFAIVRAVDLSYVGLETVKMTCGTPEVGTHLKLYGNPAGDFLDLEFLYTNAEVIGEPFTYQDYRYSDTVWGKLVPIDGVVVWGMSGGGAINDAGELEGITVGVHIANQGPMGIGFVVPSYLICGQVDHVGIDLT